MVTDELERRLLSIIKEQQSQGSKDITSGCRRLLMTLKEELILPPIDVFYILNGGREAKELFVDDVLGNPNTIYLEPNFIEYDHGELYPVRGHSLGEIISGGGSVNPRNFALLVDDCWNGGTTVKKTVRYLENLGYEKEKIFVFHYLGSGSVIGFKSERYGFIFSNPVLVSSTTMLDFFDHPWKYQ